MPNEMPEQQKYISNVGIIKEEIERTRINILKLEGTTPTYQEALFIGLYYPALKFGAKEEVLQIPHTSPVDAIEYAREIRDSRLEIARTIYKTLTESIEGQ